MRLKYRLPLAKKTETAHFLIQITIDDDLTCIRPWTVTIGAELSPARID